MFNKQKDTLIGRVLSPHGVGGMLKVFPYSDFPARINLLSRVELVTASERRSLHIEKANIYGRFWLIKFRDIDTREAAGCLSGSGLVIPKHERICLPEGYYYHDQLIGLKVYEINGTFLGAIADIISTGGHDLYLVSQAEGKGKEILIPAVKEFVREIDLNGRFLSVELPEGLLEL